MLVQKSENVFRPHGRGEIPKDMAVLRGVALGRINLHLVHIACLLHCGREPLAGRQVIIVRGLKKENRRTRILDRPNHERFAIGAPPPSFGRRPLNRRRSDRQCMVPPKHSNIDLAGKVQRRSIHGLRKPDRSHRMPLCAAFQERCHGYRRLREMGPGLPAYTRLPGV